MANMAGLEQESREGRLCWCTARLGCTTYGPSLSPPLRKVPPLSLSRQVLWAGGEVGATAGNHRGATGAVQMGAAVEATAFDRQSGRPGVGPVVRLVAGPSGRGLTWGEAEAAARVRRVLGEAGG